MAIISHWRKQQKPVMPFPSGHSFILRNTSFICVCAVYVTTPLFLASLGDIMGIDVTVGRIILGMHWASDVIVGILISAVLVCGVHFG